jgi:hypothetical protein
VGGRGRWEGWRTENDERDEGRDRDLEVDRDVLAIRTAASRGIRGSSAHALRSRWKVLLHETYSNGAEGTAGSVEFQDHGFRY